MNGFRISLETGKTYRNARTAEQMNNLNLDDVLLENYSSGQTSSFDFFVMAGEASKIKVYETEFSVGGSISITGGLPNFMESTLSGEFNMHDLLLSGEALTGMPPLHADASVEFDPGRLFGDFISAKAKFEFGINTMPETNPNWMRMRGQLGIAEVFNVEGEFVFAWGKMGNKVVFMPDTMYAYLGMDQPIGIPLIPPIVIGYITGLGGGVSGLADTAFGNYDRLPPIKLKMTASFKDVTGKILSVEKATLTVGPTEFSFIVDEAEFFKVVKLKDTGFELKLLERNGYIDSTLELRANLEVLGGLITGHASLYLATIRSNMSAAEQAYYSSIDGGNFRLPSGAEGDRLLNGFYFEGKLSARVEASLLGITAAAWGELFVSKVYISGGVGASLNVWNLFSIGFEAYVKYTYADKKFSFSRSGLPAEEGLVVAIDENGNKMHFGNVSELGFASSRPANPLSRTPMQQAGKIDLKAGDLLAIYADTKFTEVKVFLDDGIEPHETLLSHDGSVWQETEAPLENEETGEIVFAPPGKYVAFYVPETDGSYSFTADGSLEYGGFRFAPLPKLDSFTVAGTTASWTLDATATAKAAELGERLRVRLSLYNMSGDITADLGDYPANGSPVNFGNLLPGNLSGGTYSVSAILFERGDMTGYDFYEEDENGDPKLNEHGMPIVEMTIMQYDETVFNVMDSGEFTYTNPNAPSAVTGVTVTRLPNGEFSVSWNETAGADGYIVDITDSDGVTVNGLYDQPIEGGDVTSIVFQGGAITVTDIETDETLHFGIQFDEDYTVHVRAYKNITGTEQTAVGEDGNPIIGEDGEPQKINAGVVQLFGPAGSAGFAVSEPVIPEFAVEVVGARVFENDDGGLVYAVSDANVTVRISTDTSAAGVTIGDTAATGSGGVYTRNFSFSEDGTYNIPIEVTGASGDTNSTLIRLIVDTAAPVIFVDAESGLAKNGKIDVSGFVSGGTELFINGEEIALDGGLFSYEDELETTTILMGTTAEGEAIYGAATTILHLMAISPSGNMAQTFIDVLYVAEEDNGGGGGNGGDGGDSGDGDGGNGGMDNTPTTPATPGSSKTVQGTINGLPANFTQNETGGVSLTLTADDIAKYPQKDGIYTVGITRQESLAVSLPISALTADVLLLVIKTDSGSVTFTKQMLTAYQAAHGDILTVSLKAGSLTVDLLKDGGTIDYNDPANPLFITIPVTVYANTNTNSYVGILKTETGSVIMPYSVFKNYEVTFQTSRTGTFDVRYNAKTFPDIGGHLATDYFNFVGARQLFAGNEKGEFMPQAIMTRAMFVQVLANLEQADLSVYTTSRFADVAAGAWYAPAVEWAAAMGIVEGVGNSRFVPEEKITREQMALILANYVKYKGYALPVNTVPGFLDEASIASWALTAVKQIHAAGIISVKPGNLYDPQGVATRAEVATIFARFIEIYISGVLDTNTERQSETQAYAIPANDAYIDRSALEAIEQALNAADAGGE